MRSQMIQKDIVGFDHIQFRGYKAIVDTEIINLRSPESQVADRLQFISDG